MRLLPPGTPAEQARGGAVVDTEGTYTAYLNGIGARAVLVRPDFYVFGGTADTEGTPALVDALRDALPEAALTGSAAGPRGCSVSTPCRPDSPSCPHRW